MPEPAATGTRLTPLAPITTNILNPAIRLIAGWMPGLGILTHRGRRSGSSYRAPLLVLRRGDRYAIALWYGADSHWVKNVGAAGTAELRRRGRTSVVHDPVVVGLAGGDLPPLLRVGARLLRVSHVMLLRPKGDVVSGTEPPES